MESFFLTSMQIKLDKVSRRQHDGYKTTKHTKFSEKLTSLAS